MSCYQCDGYTIEDIAEIRAKRDAEIRAYHDQLLADEEEGVVSFRDTLGEPVAHEPVFYDEWNKVEDAQSLAEEAPKKAGRPKKAVSSK